MWWLYLTNLYGRYLQNLIECSVKGACIFHLILAGILSILTLYVKKKGIGRGRGWFALRVKSVKHDLSTVLKSQKSSAS